MATGEQVLRLWDIDNEENYVLNFEGQSGYVGDTTTTTTTTATTPRPLIFH